jgi:WD40 repeat protein
MKKTWRQHFNGGLGTCVRRVAAALCLGAAGLSVAQAAEPPTAPILRIETGMHTAMINRIGADAEGRYAVTASDDKTARVWDLTTGQLLRVLRPPIAEGDEGKLYATAITPDGSTVAVAGWTKLGSDTTGHAVYLFDRAGGRLLRRLNGLPNVITHLVFSPDGDRLAATLGAGNGVRVWDWRTGVTVLADGAYGGDTYGAQWGASGGLITSSYDGKLRLYRAQPAGLVKHAEVSAPGGNKPLGVAISPSGRSVAVGYSDSTRVDVLDADSLAWQFSPETATVGNGSLSRVAWSHDGQTLIAAGMWHVNGRYPVRSWPQSGRGSPQDTLATSNTIMDLVRLREGGWLVGGSDPAWGKLSAGGAWQALGSAPIADLRGSRRDAFKLNADASQVQFGFEPHGKVAHQFDLRRRQFAPGSLAGGNVPRTADLKIDGWENTARPSIDGKPLPLLQYETARSLAITADATRFVLGANWRLRYFDRAGQQLWEMETPANTWGVNIPPSGKVVVAAYGDGTIRWHRLSDGRELLAFFPHADRKRWVLWTPTGYYDTSTKTLGSLACPPRTRPILPPRCRLKRASFTAMWK